VVRPVPLNLCMPFRRPIENVNKIHKGGLLWGLWKKVDWVSVGGKPCWKSRYAGQRCNEEPLKRVVCSVYGGGDKGFRGLKW